MHLLSSWPGIACINSDTPTASSRHLAVHHCECVIQGSESARHWKDALSGVRGSLCPRLFRVLLHNVVAEDGGQRLKRTVPYRIRFDRTESARAPGPPPVPRYNTRWQSTTSSLITACPRRAMRVKNMSRFVQPQLSYAVTRQTAERASNIAARPEHSHNVVPS
jgi:hypothetical protein